MKIDLIAFLCFSVKEFFFFFFFEKNSNEPTKIKLLGNQTDNNCKDLEEQALSKPTKMKTNITLLAKASAKTTLPKYMREREALDRVSRRQNVSAYVTKRRVQQISISNCIEGGLRITFKDRAIETNFMDKLDFLSFYQCF